MPEHRVIRWNRLTGNVWLAAEDNIGGTDLGQAFSQLDAYDLIGRAGFVRWSNMLPAYGPVRECLVSDKAQAYAERITDALTADLLDALMRCAVSNKYGSHDEQITVLKAELVKRAGA